MTTKNIVTIAAALIAMEGATMSAWADRITMSALSLSQKWASDTEAAIKRYGDQDMIVFGYADTSEESDFIAFKSGVKCRLLPDETISTTDGDRLVVAGKLWGIAFDFPLLISCRGVAAAPDVTWPTLDEVLANESDEPEEPEYAMEATGLHAGVMTRDYEAILNFDPVGMWGVMEQPRQAGWAPRVAAWIRLHPDGRAILEDLGGCRFIAEGTWELEYAWFTLIDHDGTKTENAVIGVPAQKVYGQRMLFDDNRFWEMQTPDPEAEC